MKITPTVKKLIADVKDFDLFVGRDIYTYDNEHGCTITCGSIVVGDNDSDWYVEYAELAGDGDYTLVVASDKLQSLLPKVITKSTELKHVVRIFINNIK